MVGREDGETGGDGKDVLLPVTFLMKICIGEADSWGSGDADLDDEGEESILTGEVKLGLGEGWDDKQAGR